MKFALRFSRWVAAWLFTCGLLVAHAQPSAQVKTASEVPASASSKPITFSKDIPLRRDAPTGPAEGAGGMQVFFLLVIALAGAALYIYTRRRRDAGRGTTLRGPKWLDGLGGVLPVGASRAAGAEPLVLHRKRLDRQHTLYVIEWNGTHYLMGASDSRMGLIASTGPTAPSQGIPEASP